MGNVTNTRKNIYKNRCIFKQSNIWLLKKLLKNKNKNIEIFFLENDLANYLEKNLKLQKLFLKINDLFKVRIIQIIKKIWFQFFIFYILFFKKLYF